MSTAKRSIVESLELRCFLDAVAPTVQAEFIYETAPHQIVLTFSEDVGQSLTKSDLVLMNTTTGQVEHGYQLSYDADTNTAVLSYNLANGVLPDGRYRLIVDASGVTNDAGTPLDGGNNFYFNFFFLSGDANHDATVNVTDLGILATNWQATGTTFSQADFNYDGIVDVTDLGILATNWQKSLPLSASPAGLTLSSARAVRSIHSPLIHQVAAEPAPALS